MSDVGMERFYRSALNEVADVVFGGAAPGVFGAGRKSDEELAAELYRAVAERCIPPSGAPVTHDGCIVREGWTYFRRRDGLELTVQAVRGDIAVTRIGPVRGDELVRDRPTAYDRAGEELYVGDSVRHGSDEATVVSIEQGDGPFDEPRVRLSSGLGVGARCVEKVGGE